MINIKVLGGGWVTAAGIGSIGGGQEFDMPTGELGKLGRDMYVDQSDSRWGRLDRYSRAGLIAGAKALTDSGYSLSGPEVDMAMAVSTVSGTKEVDDKYFQSVIIEKGLFASPNLFAYTLPSCMLGEISIRFSLTGSEYVIMDSEPDMLSGMKMGADCLFDGYETVLAGYCNVESEELDTGKLCYPGAVFLVLGKSLEKSKLQYDGNNILFEGSIVCDLYQLVKCSILTNKDVNK